MNNEHLSNLISILEERKKVNIDKSKEKRRKYINKYRRKANKKKNSGKRVVKPVKVIKPKLEPRSWRIILTSQNKKLTEICYSSSKEDALQKFSKIIDENKKSIKFQIKNSILNGEMVPAKYELLLLNRNKENISNETMLRNDIGQFSPNKPNTEKWLIYQKADFLFEESFWVYGFNPKHQRKSFDYIFNDILLKDLFKCNYPLKRVMVYKNKLIISDDDNFEMVICKCVNDSTRLYTEMEEKCIELKMKNVFFSGFIGEAITKLWVEKIIEKTGWNKKKVMRSSTRP